MVKICFSAFLFNEEPEAIKIGNVRREHLLQGSSRQYFIAPAFQGKLEFNNKLGKIGWCGPERCPTGIFGINMIFAANRLAIKTVSRGELFFSYRREFTIVIGV